MRVLMVCLGNICRSPMAAAILRRHAPATWRIGSAGTGPWHVGRPADPRTLSECRRRGTAIDHVARQVHAGDFAAHDLILAMDRANLADLRALRRDGCVPRLIGDDDPLDPGGEVPDPYHDGPDAFAAIYDQLDRCCRALVARPGGGRA